MDVLVVSAHQDDFESGFGGLATKFVAAGHKITSIITTTPADGTGAPREKESREAHKLLYITPVFLGYPPHQLSVDQLTRQAFTKLLTKREWDAVFCHWPVDVHPDHRASAILTIEPFVQKGFNTEIFCFEVESRKGQPQSIAFSPNYYTAITLDELTLKNQMCFCHASQNPDGFWSAHEELMGNRGKECGYLLAEGYVRLTRYGKLAPWLKDFLLSSPWELPRSIGIDVDPKVIGLE